MPATKPAPPYSQGKVSALGVFAEIDTILARHRQKTSLATALPLQEKISRVLPTLGIKNISEEKLQQITSDIAQETISQTLEDVAKAQTPEQISLVLADSLTQSIINHPDLALRIKAGDDTKVFTKIVPHAQEVANQNLDILEKAAVLANLDNIAKIQDQTEQIKDLIAGSVEQTAETEAPLTPPAQREALKADLANYLKAYKEELANQLKITADNIPTLKELQNAKENAHTQATKKMASTRPAPIGPKPPSALPTHSLTANLAQVLSLRPKPPTSAPLKLPIGGNLILSNPNRVKDAYLSLLAFDQEKLAKALKENSAEIEKYKNKKSLAYRQRRAYQDALKKQARYVAAQAFHVKQPKKAGAYRTLFARAYGGRAEVASQQAWIAENYFLTSMPRIIAHNERLAAGAAFGSLGFQLAGFNPGSLFSKFRGQALANIGVGMGMGPALITGLTPQGILLGIGGKVRNVAGAVFGGLALYFLSLGQAAFTGFLIGATIGGISGAALGFLAPPILWPITVPLGFFVGGSMGGIAGALTMLGLATGSTTLAATGIGMATGATVGAVVGFALGGPVGAVIGATLGYFAGAALGYAIGQYVIPFFKSAFDAIGSAFTGGGSAVGSAAAGFLSAAGSFFTGLASTIWGGITTAAGGVFGFVSSAANFVVGGLSSLVVPASAAAIPVASGIGAVAVGGTVVGIVTATTFFTTEADIGIPGTGKNAYFSLTKAATPAQLENNQLPHDLTFAIRLTAKETKLTNITVTDKIDVQKESESFSVTEEKNGRPIPPLGEDGCPAITELEPTTSWECQFIIRATTGPKDFRDSAVLNTVTITATPQNQQPVTDFTSATVIIGTPPSKCPTGWPMARGRIAQGPQGSRSHNSLRARGEEAIDIGDNSRGTSTFATFSGTVLFLNNDENASGYGKYVDIQGICGDITFRARWAHLDSIDAALRGDSQVVFKQRIGAIDSTGNSDADHLHYSFWDGLPMQFPYIPQTPTPPSCEDGPTPCNISW